MKAYGIADAAAWEAGLPCDGRIEVLLQPVSDDGFPPALFEATGLARELGISCTVIDPRGSFLTPERFPLVTLDDHWPDEAIAALKPDPATAVVALSHDPTIDDPALRAFHDQA